MHGKCIRRFKVEETILNDAYEVCKIVNNMPRQQLCQCQDVISAYVGRLKEFT